MQDHVRRTGNGESIVYRDIVCCFEDDFTAAAIVGRPAQVYICPPDVNIAGRLDALQRHRAGLGHRETGQLGRAADIAAHRHAAAVGVQRQRLTAVDRRGERDAAVRAAAVLVAVHRHVGMKVHRTGELDVAAVRLVDRPVQVDVGALDVDLAGGLHALEVDLPAVHRQAGQLGGAARRTLEIHRTAVGVQRQRLAAVHRRGERDAAVRAAAVLVAVHRHVGMKVHRTGELDVAAVRLVGGPVQVDVGALDVDLAGGLHAVEVDLPAVHRQAGQLGGAARRTLEIHRTAVGVQRQRLAAVHRRGERDAAVRAAAVLVAVHRHVGMKVHRTGELDVAAVRLVGRPVQVDVGALDVDLAGGLHAVEVDLPAVHRQAGQLGGAARRTLEIHRTAVGVQRQRLAAVHRRGERDAAVRAAAVLVAVHRHVGMKVHRTGELDVAAVRLVGRPVQVDVGALDVDLAGGLHTVEVDLPAVHRQAGQLGRAARRTLEIHRTAVGVQRQRLAAVHRRAERDAAVRAAAVLVAVHRHVGMKVHRTGELDVAAVRLVGRPVQVDVGALDVDLAGGLHALEVDLTAVHRQARQLGGAARRTLEIHRTAVGVQRQRLAAVDRRGERDAAVRAAAVLVAVHRHVRRQVHRTGELDVAAVRLVGRPVQVDVGALDVDRARRLHTVEVDLTAVHRQAGQLGGAARRTLEIHRTAVGVQRQRLAAVHRRAERDVTVRRIVVRIAVNSYIRSQCHCVFKCDVAIVSRDIGTQSSRTAGVKTKGSTPTDCQSLAYCDGSC